MDTYRSFTDEIQRITLQIRRGNVSRIRNARGIRLRVHDGTVSPVGVI